MLSMLRTDQARREIFSEIMSQTSNDDQLFDHLSCPRHPGFKLQGLCPKENFQPSMLCIKCMIDPEIEKRIKIDNFIAIQDVINKSTTINELDAQSQADREAFKNRIVDFSSKDYLDSFERHAETQIKKLHKEVERVKESLDGMESLFKMLFEKQFKYLKSTEQELKKKINEYVVDQEQQQRFLNLTSEEIIETIKKTTSVREYEKFIKILFYRGSPDQRSLESSMINMIMEVMDDLREKTNKMKNYKVETSILEEIRQKIESIEIVDQGFQGTSLDLSSNLAQTLKEVSEIDNKRKSGIKTPKIEYIEPVTPKRTDMFAALKERLASFSKREPGNQKVNEEMQQESAFNFESSKKREKKPDPFSFLFAKAHNTDRLDEKLKNYNSSQKNPIDNATQTQTAIFNTLESNSMEFDEERDYYRSFDENQAHRRQKTDVNSYRRISERRAPELDVMQEEHEESHGLYNNSAEYSFREKNMQDHVEVPSSQVRTNSKSKEHYSRGNTQKSKYSGGGDDDEQRREKNHESRQQQHHHPHRGPRSQSYAEELDYSESSGDAKMDSGDTDNSNATPSKKAERVKGLHDWINRRLTGYLVYQNSIQDGELEREYEGDHLNRVAGQKWRSMSKTEQEVYKSIALKARVQLKKEFQDVGKDSAELAGLQEVVEKRIRKVKKT